MTKISYDLKICWDIIADHADNLMVKITDDISNGFVLRNVLKVCCAQKNGCTVYLFTIMCRELMSREDTCHCTFHFTL